ncbi:P-type conjugative transfer protein TrbL [Shinella yambaruensis]|uniref:P-type conjugative transfer protein TrbL n=1 Tax=Shinella yambaruensis TaxID=415996 RepID=A0ABQ5ZSP3_9HYPH|nr:P-type conjugative transfer protein TrbL [Shinella yambaruensis]MCJ8029971.1 P-type conjugative transfer protein TrbL [Shinella yambaruensis]MCU7984231.1 P-type conjugative transfer protein TrbL [Shinella yambaruensis]GLR55170.1 hypothetical protein GCM10007923_63920 [Shinella yambaruensis]
MKKLYWAGPLALVLFAVFLFPSDLFAQDLSEPSTSANSLIERIEDTANGWADTLREYARTLFWMLALIQLVFTFIPMVLKGADFGEIVGDLVRFILVIGFFAALLEFSVEWATAIVDSFRQAGGSASGFGDLLWPGDILVEGLMTAEEVSKGMSAWRVGAAIVIGFSALIIAACYAFMAAFMFVALVESYIVINASVLFMGFGASQWTREYAMAMIRYAFSVGAKIFVLILLVGLIKDQAIEWRAAYQENSGRADLLTLVGLSLMCAYLTKTIPDMVQGLITGVSPGGGSAIGAVAAAGLAGAATGVGVLGMAASKLGAATEGLSKAVKGMSGSGGGSTGAAVGGSGLQDAIGSSLRGASAPTGSAASTPGGTSSGETGTKAGTASSPRVGGGSQISSKPPTGGGSPATPSGSGPSSGSKLAKAAHGIADGALKMTGVVGAITTPGMEGSTSIGLAPLQTNPPGEDADWDGGDHASSNNNQQADKPENTIRPANAETSMADLKVQGMDRSADPGKPPTQPSPS